MRRTLLAFSFLSLVSPAALAAESVGAQYENEVILAGQVVDILCELTGDCPKGCGEGKRVLGLKSADNTIYVIGKGPPLFANANESVLPFCGNQIEVDGLLIKNPKIPALFVQKYRAKGTETWKDADDFEVQWKAKNGDTEEWFRKDANVVGLITKNGRLGIPGLEPKK